MDLPVMQVCQVMLSYRKDDCAESPRGDGTAVQMKLALEAQGWTVFLDQANIEAGNDWCVLAGS